MIGPSLMCFQVFGKSGKSASNIFSWRGVVLLFYLFAPCAAKVRGHFQPPAAAGRNSVPLLRGTWAEHMFADSRGLDHGCWRADSPYSLQKTDRTHQLTATKHKAQCKALSQLNKKEFIKKIKWFPEKWDFCSCAWQNKVCVSRYVLEDEVMKSLLPAFQVWAHIRTHRHLQLCYRTRSPSNEHTLS